jgi:hypothetical protein
MFGRRVKATATTAVVWYGVTVTNALAAVPDPGHGTAPPGFDKFLVVLRWVTAIALGFCVLGFIMCAATIAISHRNGGGGNVGERVGSVMMACILIGAASAIVTALT